MNSQNQQKSKKFLLTAGILSAIVAVLLVSSNLNSDTLNLFGNAQFKTQAVKTWNFDSTNEGWKSRFTRDARAKNGSLNVRIGQTFFSPFIFNRRVLTQMPLPLKYFSINLAIQKRKEINIPVNQPTPIPVEPLTNEDIQILSLPEQTTSPSATGQTEACTADVKSCEDGSFVGRTPPSCAFLPCPERPSSFFTFDFQFKTVGSDFWSKPFPITGRISPNFQEYTIKLPVFNPLTIEAIKIELRNGIGKGDVILIDSMKLLNEKLIPPTRPPSPTPGLSTCNQVCSPDGILKPKCAPGLECTLIGPSQTTPPMGFPEAATDAGNMPITYLCRNPQDPNDSTCGADLTPTPPRPSCVPPPPCAYGGVVDDQGNKLYCDPMPGLLWCPNPSITITPCITKPPCADGIQSPDGYTLYCRPPEGSFWCPRVTPPITLTPTCLSGTPPPCQGGTLQQSEDPQSPGVCPPKIICIFPDTPTPSIP